MEKELKKKSVAVFNGMSVNKHGIVVVKFILRYDEIVNSISLLQGLNTDITVHAKTPDMNKPVNLGLFFIDGVTFDKDGNARVTFKSLTDNVNLDNICKIITTELMQLRFMAVLDLPDKQEENKKEE